MDAIAVWQNEDIKITGLSNMKSWVSIVITFRQRFLNVRRLHIFVCSAICWTESELEGRIWTSDQITGDIRLDCMIMLSL